MMTARPVLRRRDFSRLAILGGSLAGSSLSYSGGAELRVLRVRKIFSDGKHNAFTGLVRFEDRYFIAFRSAANHLSLDGAVRVIASPAADRWTVAHTASRNGEDLRDPKLAVFRGKLFVYFAARPETDLQHRTSMALVSHDGAEFGEPRILEGVPDGYWLWHAAAHGEWIYGTAYRRRRASYHVLLLRSADGLRWEKAAEFPLPGGETYLDFAADGSLWAFVRNNSPGHTAYVCQAEPPYDSFEPVEHFPTHIGGPMIKRLDGGCVLITRQWDPPGRRNLRTEIFWMADGARPVSVTRLPSGGDTSYATWLDTAPDRALVSYYSSHEHTMDVAPSDPPHRDSAHAEHSTGADIFLASVSY